MELSEEAQKVYDYRERVKRKTGRYPSTRMAHMSVGWGVYNRARKELVEKDLWKAGKKFSNHMGPNTESEYTWRDGPDGRQTKVVV